MKTTNEIIIGNVLPALIAYVHSTGLIAGCNIFIVNVTPLAFSEGTLSLFDDNEDPNNWPSFPSHTLLKLHL